MESEPTKAVQLLSDGIREHLDEYIDYTWESPGKDFVNKRSKPVQEQLEPPKAEEAPWMTPAASPQPEEIPYPAEAFLPIR